MSPTILIVDDEKHTREGLRRSLEPEFEVYIAADIQEALNILENDTVEVLITDLRLAGEDGMDLIGRALSLSHPPICIMMTAYGSVDTAVEAMRRGAYDFVTKPINIENLEILIKRALRSRDVEQENNELRQQVEKKFGLENLIGESAVMHEVFDTIRQVAPTQVTVLIEGESGTGKELVAKAIHNLSTRAKNKFVAVHCAALSAQLLESELFGHEKGAFTHAFERRIGRFEQASGGTLFLDEIGEIDAGTQVKILRVLGERTFERVGGNTPIQANVRLLAATNKVLEEMVQEGSFREDLYYRLNVVQIHLPPLRERTEDIPIMVHAFLREAARENQRPDLELSSEALDAILQHSWPGNVRELRAAVEHGVVMARTGRITVRDLPASVRSINTGARPTPWLSARNRPLNIHESELRMIQRALEECEGNRTEAAKRLGISRRTLYRRLDELEGRKPA